MRRLVLAAIVAASLGAVACGGEDAPPPRVRYRLWKAPLYLVAGLPRDVIDAPSKALSSIPIFNRVFIVPLAALNAVTTATSWSFTDEGVVGGFEAWVHCLRLPRRASRHRPPKPPRPWWRDYFPNWRSFGIIEREPPPQ